MKAIILAAGRGTRLENVSKMPKCLLSLGNETLLSRMIHMLNSFGISDITLVTGFCHQKVEGEAVKVASNIKVYYNPFFEYSNSIASLWMAREEIFGNIICMNADLYLEEGILGDLLNDHRSSVMLSDSTSRVNADYKFEFCSDRIVSYGKSLPLEKTHAEYVGVAKINKDFSKKFRLRLNQKIKQGDINDWWEDVLYSFISDGVPIFYKDIAGLKWGEVDTASDYVKLKKIFEYKNRVARET